MKKGAVTKSGAEKYERAIKEIEMLKSTGKKGPVKRKKDREDKKNDPAGAEDLGPKIKIEKEDGRRR